MTSDRKNINNSEVSDFYNLGIGHDVLSEGIN